MIFERMNLRLPTTLKVWLKEQAEAHHRTMNGEIVVLLERAKADAKKGTA